MNGWIAPGVMPLPMFRALTRLVAMPGPVDQNRVLVRALTPDAGDLAGPVRPA